MNKREKAIKETVAYLKSHNICFEISFENGTICVVTKLKAHDAPNHRVEVQITLTQHHLHGVLAPP